MRAQSATRLALAYVLVFGAFALGAWASPLSPTSAAPMDEAIQASDKQVEGGEHRMEEVRSDNISREGRLGISARQLNVEELKKSRLSGGLMVEKVAGPAEIAGVRPGDIIVSVNGVEVRTLDQLNAFVAKQVHQVGILIVRGNARLFMPVPLG